MLYYTRAFFPPCGGRTPENGNTKEHEPQNV